MSGFLEKSRRVLNDRKMLKAYLLWLTSKTLCARPPRHSIGSGVRIGGWINFSEYHSYTTSSGILPGEAIFARQALFRSGAESVAFDVGANIGIFSCLFGLVSEGSVHSFEAIPETFCRLRRNVVANCFSERCVLNCFAVGRDSGLVTFKVDPRSPGTNRLVSQRSAGGSDACVSFQQVPSISLDSYCEQLGIGRIDLMKIDVEGMEPLVLEGAARLLANKCVRSILIEISPANLIEAGFDPTNLYGKILRFGYQPFPLNEDGTLGEPMACAELCAIDSRNIILLPV